MPEVIDPILLAQRVRNRIIEVLELYASYEEQNAYQQAVPFIHVPTEAIVQWEDWVNPALEQELATPVYSAEEVAALGVFHAVWEDICERTPNPLPQLDVVQQTKPWSELRDAATDCLAVLNKRGRFPEEELVADGR